MRNIVKRYNIKNNEWEIGYYIGTCFHIIGYEPNYEDEDAA